MKCITLKPQNPLDSTSSGDWKLDDEELENAFNDRTKMIVVNSPNNPLGKVFSRVELEKIAKLCIKHNVLCISDEVYEFIVYDRPHIRMGILWFYIYFKFCFFK